MTVGGPPALNAAPINPVRNPATYPQLGLILLGLTEKNRLYNPYEIKRMPINIRIIPDGTVFRKVTPEIIPGIEPKHKGISFLRSKCFLNCRAI